MSTKPDPLQTQKIRMLDRFYGLFIWFCLVLLGIGVPFIFYRKVVSAVLIGLVIAGILLARRVSQRGSPERSLILFSLVLWTVLTTLTYGGLPPNGAGVALATGVMLAVVVSNRAGIIFVSTYLLMLLSYVALQLYELAPAPYFAQNPLVAWLLIVGAFMLTLIPIPELIRALNEGASRQRSVLEATSDAILVVDLSGVVDSYNQRFVDLWDIPRELIEQRSDAQLLDYVLAKVANPQEFIQRVTDLYAIPDQSSFDKFSLKDKRVIERYSQPHLINDKVVGRVWSFRDVTARDADRDELKASQTKLQTLFDLSPLGLARNGMDGVFFEVNMAFSRMLGYNLEELNSMSYWDITPQVYADQEALQIDNLRTKGSYGPYEKEYIHKDGHRFPVRLNGILIQDENGESYIWSIIEDITNQKIHEANLTEAVNAAEDASRAKGQFLANMSHEIRTPMNAILGMLKLLHHTELTPQQLDYANKSQSAAKDLLGLINDILDFSKVEAGQMTLDPQPFRIDALMRDLAVILSTNVGAKEVEVLYDIDQDLPQVVLGDAMRLRQILINLGGNAVKFTTHGQVVVSVHLQHQDMKGATLQFAVKDSGIGIAPENQQRIFTGFSQAEASTTRVFGGTGLGLAISQRMVHIMGGELKLDSAVGQGSTFSFSLMFPLVEEVPAELQESPRSCGQPRRVLVIDDNVVACELTARMAQSWNWETDIVHSGEEALALIEARMSQAVPKAFPFDVLYVDWFMKGMDGWDTVRRVRALSQELGGTQPVIVMVTANSRESLSQRTEEEQGLINGFLVKPVTASILLDATLQPDASQAGLRKKQRITASKRRLNGMRILVVEDNRINQQVAEELLISEGALVSLAANGQLGVDAVATADPQFDVVLMDVQMPVLDGYAATKVIREKLALPDLPIIAMTANAMASDRQECLDAGMNEHVGKPFDLTQLVNTILHITGDAVTDGGTPGISVAASGIRRSGMTTIDLEGALARMSGMKSLYLQAAQEFVKVLSETSAQFRSALETDQSGAIRHMHTLKGTAALLGATALSASALELERLCKSGVDFAGLLRQADQFDRQIVVTTHAMTEVIQRLMGEMDVSDSGPARAGTAPQPDLSPAQVLALRGQLQDLGELLVNSDLTALEKFAEMQADLNRLADAPVQELQRALKSLELDDAHRVCLKILEELPEVH